MADMPSEFWAGWIIVITSISMVGLGWLIYSAYFTPRSPQEDIDDLVWDEDLHEGKRPAPMWWFWLTFALLVFSVVYLMLYPGLGSFAGALQWSQGGRFQDSLVAFENRFGGMRRFIVDARLESLGADPALMASAQRVYDRNCAACHGYDAKGVAGYFPDLTDAEWQWGASASQIEQSIRKGRTAVMVGWLPVLGEEGVEQVADYVKILTDKDAREAHPGRTTYAQYCAVCHGPTGIGNPLLGAPSLIDQVSLYGNDGDAIKHSIAMGRSGQMPAFGKRLDDTQIRLLVALLSQAATQ